jgi:hypothetical protein
MTEDFLHYVWEQGLYDTQSLTGVNGESIEVVSPGTRNTDSGPDYFNALIRIDDTLWAGNVEIHRNSSDWMRHQHQDDLAYDSVVLHVVGRHDLVILRSDGKRIPELALTFPEQLLVRYEQLLASRTWIPCQNNFHAVDPFMLKIGFNRLMVERLQEKTAEIHERLEVNLSDWNETFYQFLARNFGFKINALPFELLAKSLSWKILSKHADHLFQLEALLFGQSGLLNEALIGDDYFLQLREEYGFLYKKYGLRPIAGHLWKFLRLRPVNFPTLRIAQLAALMARNRDILPAVLEAGNPDEIARLFEVKASDYWDRHYKFNYPSRKCVKHLGVDSVNNLMVNTIIPFLFVFGEQNNKPILKDRALEWLERLPAESNSVVTGWESLGVQPQSAFETQALLQLKNRYCAVKKCIKCHVGNKIIRGASE